MARRRPTTFTAWALGLLGTIITALVLYHGRIAIIEQMGQRQIERAEALQQRLQQQARQPTQHTPPAQPTHDPYAAQVAQAAAESKRHHDEAWNHYYQPKQGCDAWQSDAHMVECVNHKMRARGEFERKWAAGEIKTPQG